MRIPVASSLSKKISGIAEMYFFLIPDYVLICYCTMIKPKALLLHLIVSCEQFSSSISNCLIK
jgi:hypothetical protein